jgi:hypothetical protein
MICPLCQKEMVPGLTQRQYTEGYYCIKSDNFMSYHCPNNSNTPIGSTVSHFTVNGSHAIATVGSYRLCNWLPSPNNPGGSTVLHFVEGQGFTVVVDNLPIIPFDTEERLLKRLQLLVLLS